MQICLDCKCREVCKIHSRIFLYSGVITIGECAIKKNIQIPLPTSTKPTNDLPLQKTNIDVDFTSRSEKIKQIYGHEKKATKKESVSLIKCNSCKKVIENPEDSIFDLKSGSHCCEDCFDEDDE